VRSSCKENSKSDKDEEVGGLNGTFNAFSAYTEVNTTVFEDCRLTFEECIHFRHKKAMVVQG
jgi:hypothetical protein